MKQSPQDLDSTLIDLTKVSLAKLRTLDDTALTRSLRRLVEQADDPKDFIAGFNASI